METEALARKFLTLSMVNGFLAVIFTAPILIPQLCIATPPTQFGCKATMDIVWPGTWVLVAWLAFIIAGVLGTLFWGASYFFAARVFNRTQVSKGLGWLHLVLYEVGVYGATGMMAAIGFVGGSQLASGGSQIVAAVAIAQNIIPPLSSDPSNLLYDMPPIVEAIFIGLTLLGAIIGIVAYFRTKKAA